MSVVDDYRKLLTAKQQLQQRQATAVALREQKQTELNNLLAQAKTTWGVNSYEELVAMKDKLEAEMAKTIEEVRGKCPQLFA